MSPRLNVFTAYCLLGNMFLPACSLYQLGDDVSRVNSQQNTITSPHLGNKQRLIDVSAVSDVATKVITVKKSHSS